MEVRFEEQQHSLIFYSSGEEEQNSARICLQISVANKTGALADVENDAGIIYNTQNDLILVFMSDDFQTRKPAQTTIAALSQQIYD